MATAVDLCSKEAIGYATAPHLCRAHLEELAAGALPDLCDSDVMDGAWRG
jgi:hypothetical protein